MALYFRPPPPPPAPTSFTPPASDLIDHYEKSVVDHIALAPDNLRVWFQEADEDNNPIQTLSNKHHFTTSPLELFESVEDHPLWNILYPSSRFEDNLIRQLQFICTGVDNLANKNTIPTPSPPAPTTDILPTLAAMEANIVSLQQETLTTMKSYTDASKVSTPKPPITTSPPTKPTQPKSLHRKSTHPQAVIQFKGNIEIKNRPPFNDLVTNLNKSLHNHPKHSHICVVGVKWTAASNLVVRTQAPSPSALVSALKAVQATIMSDLLIIKDIIPNMRWPHMTLSHIFTSKGPDLPVYSPEAIHEELSMHNPNYASLIIRQPPSWIRNPKNFTDGKISSISFTFEDPDGSLARQLADTPLTAFGNLRCTLKAWTTLEKPLQKGKHPSAADN